MSLIPYIVTYDIRDPKRLRLVYKTLRGFGEHWQYSVFHCLLSDASKVELVSALEDLINTNEDQVLLARLASRSRTPSDYLQFLGAPPRTPRPGSRVI